MRVRINGVIAPYPQSVVTVTPPSAGTDFSYTVPTGALWRLVSAILIFTTDANAANRHVRLRIRRGTPVIGLTVSNAVHTANGVASMASFQRGMVGNNTTATSHTAALPVLPTLMAGDVIESSVTNIQAGDTFTGIYLTFEKVQ